VRTIPKRLLSRIQAVQDKRPRTVLDHILEHGQITTQELRDVYGYNHPPRAAQDVKEHGIPLETFRVSGKDGRKIAAYRIALDGEVGLATKHGRMAFSRAVKQQLLRRDGSRCRICYAELHARYLQVDHRIPYDIGGEKPDPESHLADYMLVCGSCNRAKSWSCEHCSNRQSSKRIATCRSCYWARPDSYTHIATVAQRRVALVWVGREESGTYDRLSRRARNEGKALGAVLKEIVAKEVD